MAIMDTWQESEHNLIAIATDSTASTRTLIILLFLIDGVCSVNQIIIRYGLPIL